MATMEGSNCYLRDEGEAELVEFQVRLAGGLLLVGGLVVVEVGFLNGCAHIHFEVWNVLRRGWWEDERERRTLAFPVGFISGGDTRERSCRVRESGAIRWIGKDYHLSGDLLKVPRRPK